LERVLITHSPGGWEEEMDEIVIEEFKKCANDVQKDHKGNIYIVIPGKKPGPRTLITAHKDEISVIVKKIDDDGKIWLEPIGGIRPSKYGEGPFDLITENGIIPGILNMGSAHSSPLSSRTHRTKTESITWDLVYLDCKLNAEELEKKGAMIGDRALVARTRKTPMYLHDEYVGGYSLDDKAGVAVLILLAQELKKNPPSYETIIAITSEEESGVSGAQYLCRTLTPEKIIALEIAPIAEEYPIKMNDQPVILLKDSMYFYDKGLSRELIAAGKRQEIQCQRAVVRSFGSDASKTSESGLVPYAACLCFPTENTHGFEVTSLGALENCLTILYEHLTS
jgi:putative aminopeptidase FrvX